AGRSSRPAPRRTCLRSTLHSPNWPRPDTQRAPALHGSAGPGLVRAVSTVSGSGGCGAQCSSQPGRFRGPTPLGRLAPSACRWLLEAPRERFDQVGSAPTTPATPEPDGVASLVTVLFPRHETATKRATRPFGGQNYNETVTVSTRYALTLPCPSRFSKACASPLNDA